MKKYLLLILLLIVIPSMVSAATVDTSATVKTQQVLAYLANLSNLTTNKIISGQFNGWTNTEDTADCAEVYTDTGKYPAMIGISYTFDSPLTHSNDLAIAYNAAGGLVYMTGHLLNPASGSLDMTSANLTNVVTEGHALNIAFKAELDRWAAGLLVLQTNNVPVLMHLMAEMNEGPYYWWGTGTIQEYKNLWIYVFNYWTATKGVHNLLYMFNASNNYASTSNMTDYYPGNAYVDLIGIDYYQWSPGVDLYEVDLVYHTLGHLHENYDAMRAAAPGKPFGLSEYGPCDSASPCTWDTISVASLAQEMADYIPDAVFFLFWNEGWGMAKQLGVSTLLNDSRVITREEVVLGGTVPILTGGSITGVTFR